MGPYRFFVHKEQDHLDTPWCVLAKKEGGRITVLYEGAEFHEAVTAYNEDVGVSLDVKLVIMGETFVPKPKDWL